MEFMFATSVNQSFYLLTSCSIVWQQNKQYGVKIKKARHQSRQSLY